MPRSAPLISWCIYGGESGRGYRQDERAWAYGIRALCKRMGVGFWYKQEAGFRPATNPKLGGVSHHGLPLVVLEN